jgi:DNA-binding protein HU-beta
VISKSDLANRIAKKTNVSMAKGNDIVNTVLDSITDALAHGEEVRLTGFGTFKISQRAARTARNPRTGQPIQVPASRRPTFSAGTKLVEAVRGSSVQKKKAA